jgi:hypothetical protein
MSFFVYKSKLSLFFVEGVCMGVNVWISVLVSHLLSHIHAHTLKNCLAWSFDYEHDDNNRENRKKIIAYIYTSVVGFIGIHMYVRSKIKLGRIRFLWGVILRINFFSFSIYLWRMCCSWRRRIPCFSTRLWYGILSGHCSESPIFS